MKNITVAVTADVYHKARVKAAERDTSVSALVRTFLMDLTQEESDFDRLKRLQTEVLSSIRNFRAGDRLSRQKIHERHAIR